MHFDAFTILSLVSFGGISAFFQSYSMYAHLDLS